LPPVLAVRSNALLAFSIWNALWVVFVTFLFVNLLMMLFAVIYDLFRDKELSGVAKVVWIIVLLGLPLLGLLIYVIARGQGMAERSVKEQVDAKDSLDSYVREVAGGGAASELEKASNLLATGQITDDEYAALKTRILS
jgi:ABC-type multidrug transport system fused ATPase/permease subunit